MLNMRRKTIGILILAIFVFSGISRAEEGAAALREKDILKKEEEKAAERKEHGFLEPDIIDNAFSKYVGERIGDATGDFRFEISEIPGFDTGLDRFGEVSPFDFELGFTLANKYIWRGQALGPNTSWQPYVTVSPDFEPLGDLSFTFWADITRGQPVRNRTEYDFVVDYNFDFLELVKLVGGNDEKIPYVIKKLVDFNFDAGFIYYYFPPNQSNTKEFYWAVEYNLPLHPSFTIYNDWYGGRGMWLEWGISQDLDLSLFTLSTYAKLGYNKRQWTVSSALQTLDFGASIPMPIGKHMKIEPFISYSKRLNNTVTEDGDPLTRDEIYGGFDYSINF